MTESSKRNENNKSKESSISRTSVKVPDVKSTLIKESNDKSKDNIVKKN